MIQPQQELLEIIKSKKTVQESDVFKLFDKLDPVEEGFLEGTWSGDPVETGHQTSKWLEEIKFAGKKFNSYNDVEPVFVFDENNKRVFYEPTGRARLREVKYRGVVSATLIYDSRPVMDYFRKIDNNTVIAAADNKYKNNGTFFFYLRRGEDKV